MMKNFLRIVLLFFFFIYIFFKSSVTANDDNPCPKPEHLITNALPNCGYGLVFTQYFETITLTISYDLGCYVNPKIEWSYSYDGGKTFTIVERDTSTHTVNKNDLRINNRYVNIFVKVTITAEDPHLHGDPPVLYKTFDSYTWHIDYISANDRTMIYRGLSPNYFWPGKFSLLGRLDYVYNREIQGNPGWCSADDPWAIVNLVSYPGSSILNPWYGDPLNVDDRFWVHSPTIKVQRIKFVGFGEYDLGHGLVLSGYQKDGPSYEIGPTDRYVGPKDPYLAYVLENRPTMQTINASGQLVTITPANILVIHGAFYPQPYYAWLAGKSTPNSSMYSSIFTIADKNLTIKVNLVEEPDFINWQLNGVLQPEHEAGFIFRPEDNLMVYNLQCCAAKAVNEGMLRLLYNSEWNIYLTGYYTWPAVYYTRGHIPYVLNNGVSLDLKTGDFHIAQTDLILSGRGGLDLRLTRLYTGNSVLPPWAEGPEDYNWQSILTAPMPNWIFDLPCVTPYYIYYDGKIYPNCLETERRQWGVTAACFPWARGCVKIGDVYYYRDGKFRLATDGDNVILTTEDGTSYTFPCWENVAETSGWSYGPLSLITDKTGANRITFSYSESKESVLITDSVGRKIVIDYEGITVDGTRVVTYSAQVPMICAYASQKPGEEEAYFINMADEPFKKGEVLQIENSNDAIYTITDALGRIQRIIQGDDYLDVISWTGDTVHLTLRSVGINNNCVEYGTVNGREIRVDYSLTDTSIFYEVLESITLYDGIEKVTTDFYIEEFLDPFGYGLNDFELHLSSLSDGHRTYRYTYERREGTNPGFSPANNWYDLLSSIEVTQGDSSYTRTFTYDEDGRLISTTGPDGTVEYTYHVIDEPDRYFVGVATRTHGPLTTTHSYNGLGQVVSVRSGSAPATCYEYDGYGNVKKIIDPKGNETEIVYDDAYHAFPAVVGTRGPDGGWERCEANEYYYPFGWLKKRTVGPYETTYTYDAVGRVLTAADRTGTTTTTYNDEELWTETTDPEGNRTRTTFDQLGRTVRVESFTAGGVSLGTTEYVYDPQHDDRLWKMLQNGQLVQEIIVDEDADTRTTRDADGNTSIEYYDLAGRLVKTESYLAVAEGEEPAVRTTTYAYDPETGALASLTDPARTTAYHYNDRGLVDLVAYSDGKTEETVYDENGNPVRVKDRGGRWTDYEYNRYNEVTSVKIGQETVATYAYDNLGRVITAGAGDVQYTYTYDDLGRLEWSTRTIRGRIYELHYDYDDYDRMAGLTVKDAAGLVLTRFGYAYTPETVRVSAEVNGEMKEFAAAEIGEGGVTAGKTLGNGLAQSFGYDARLRLVESTVAGAAGVRQSHAYEYGLAGNITRIDAQSFGYDRLGHLTAATGGLEDIAYEYDPLGNRLRETKGGTVTEYVYQDGLLVQAGATSYTYHPDGSLATKTRPGEAWEYAYDIRGRLTTVTLNGAAIGTYGYDQDGLRVWKEENGRTTIYVRDGLEVLYEEDFAGPVTPETVPVATRARVFFGGEIVGLVVNGVEAHYFVNDHLGTTELATDERGRLRENIVHTPFSERIHVTAYSYREQRLTETEWLDLTNTTARIEDGQAGPAKVPVEVEELLHRDDTPVLVEDPHYTPAKEYIYHHDDPDVLELKVTSGFKDPETGGYVEYVDLLDLSGKPLGDYRIVLETRKDVGQTGPTENLKFEVYVSKRLRSVESVLRTKPISLGDACSFSFTPQGTGLGDITWSISRDGGQTWAEVTAGALLPADGASEILLKADLEVVEGHEPPVVTGLDWVFVSERETSERYTFTGKARDASGLYYFGGRYYDPEVGRWTAVDPARDGLNWYEYCSNNPLKFFDENGLWEKVKTGWVAEKGDTLWGLAQLIYGKGTEWRRLQFYGDPQSLQIGQVIPDPIDSVLQKNFEWASNNQNIIGYSKWLYKVQPHGEWDYKNNSNWNQVIYNWNNLKLTAEDLGNLNYGLTGAALGLSRELLLIGDAMANLFYGRLKSPFISPSLGDDPRDIFYVHFGYEYYDVIMGNQKFWEAFIKAYYQVY